MSELERLRALNRCAILDTPPEPDFDLIVTLGLGAAEADAAAIGFLDEDRFWFKARVGVAGEHELRKGSLGECVLSSREPLVIEDVERDASGWNGKLGGHAMRAAVVLPLTGEDDQTIGALVVACAAPRGFNEVTVERLSAYASLVSSRVALRRRALVAERHESATRRLTAALGESETRFEQGFEHAIAGMAIQSLDGRFLRVNDALCAMVGHKRDELLRLGALDVTHPDDRDLTRSATAEILEGPRNATLARKRYARADGMIVTAITSTTLVRDAQGHPMHFIVQMLDITDMVAAEAELQRLAAMVLDSEDAIVASDRDHRITSWNLGAERLYGWSAPETVGRPVDLLAAPGLERELLELLERVLAGETVVHDEARGTCRDGSLIDVSVSFSAVHDESGAVVGVSSSARNITRTKQAERMLRASEERYRRIVETSEEGIWILGDDGRVTFANRRMAELLGLPVEELIGRALHDFLPSEDIAETRANLASGAPSVQLEVRMRRVDGTDVWVLLNGTLLHDEQQQPCGYLALASDITARREATEELRLSELRLGEAQRVARVGSWEVDGATDAVRVSDEVYRLLGYEPGEVVYGADLLNELGLPEDRPILASSLARLRAGESTSCRYRILPHGDQSVRTLHIRGEAEPSTEGVPPDRFGTIQDITELVEVEEARRQSEEHFRVLVESAQDIVAIVDVEGVLQYVNPAFNTILGQDPEAAIGRPYASYAHPDDFDMVNAAVEAVIEGVPNAAFRTRALHVDGSLRLLEGTVTRLPEDDRLRLLFIARDISESARAEEREERLQGQLEQTQRLETVGQLAGGIAHDFNNLLAVITSYSSYLAKQLPEGSQLREDVGEIRAAADRAGQLTHQLLVFSRREVAVPEVLEPATVLRNVERLLARTLGAHVELRTDAPEDGWRVEADAGQLEQVLLNLAINARDAMPRGGQLRIACEDVELDEEQAHEVPNALPGPYVRVTVADTGEGMDEETIARAFEPFFTTKPQGQGTGLGLATAYGIITASHGHIVINSAPGSGTVMSIYLPAAGDSSECASTPVSAPEEDLGGRGETVLVVEDNDAVRLLSRRMLTRSGYEVLDAASGLEALELIEDSRCRVDLVLTDVQMPYMSGTEVARRVALIRPALPVVFMSGYSEDAALGDLVERGNTPFLAKPFAADTLLRVVRDALARRVSRSGG